VSLTDLEFGRRLGNASERPPQPGRFLHHLSNLETVLLHMVIVDDRDYSPLLALPGLMSVRVVASRDMRPTYDELERTLPWSD